MTSQLSSISDLYISRKNLLKYLKNEGYNTEIHEKTTMTEIQAMKPTNTNDTTTSLDFEVIHEDNEQKCNVFYYLKQKFHKVNFL